LLSLGETKHLSASFSISRGARATQEKLDLLGVEGGKGLTHLKKETSSVVAAKRGDAEAAVASTPDLALEAGDATTFAGEMVRGGEEFDLVPVPYTVDAGALVGAMVTSGAEFDIAY